ncbi:hypothetical protein MYX65_09500, partial [Acidobacteria bacterium AH-259-L09]|nr:hypothetical protein [Acidobacteria bacterium AH-259-L09]
MSDTLESLFNNLADAPYNIISEVWAEYNCVAWAAGETYRKWWPIDPPFAYWPESTSREETLDSFILAFKTLGYEPCDDDKLETGYEKVAIYVDS